LYLVTLKSKWCESTLRKSKEASGEDLSFTYCIAEFSRNGEERSIYIPYIE